MKMHTLRTYDMIELGKVFFEGNRDLLRYTYNLPILTKQRAWRKILSFETVELNLDGRKEFAFPLL